MTRDIQNIKQDPIVLDLDKPRKFFLGMRGFAILAEKYGSVQKAQEKFFTLFIKTDENGQAVSPEITVELLEAIVIFAKAGLDKFNPEIETADLENMIDSSNNTMFEIMRGILYCFGFNLPKNEEPADPIKARAKKTGRGSTSTQSPALASD